MDKVKQVVGLSKEGQEPVSGEQGRGTAAEPYDQGNDQEDTGKSGKAAQDISTKASDTANKVADSAKTAGSTNDAKSSKISRLFSKKKRGGRGGEEQPIVVPAAGLSDRPPNHLGDDVPPGVNATLEKQSTASTSMPSIASKGVSKRSSFWGGWFGSGQHHVTTQGGKKVTAGGQPVGQAAMKQRASS